MKPLRKLTPILLILILGGWLRFSGMNWDSGYHLQPDERYISLVLSSLSPRDLSPYTHGYGAYIYGQLPLTVLTYLSRWLGMEGYDRVYLLGRGISAFLDTLSIILVYKLGKRLWNEKVGVIGAGFYAFAPLAIQYSHFMTMESWATFSWLLVVLLLSRIYWPSRMSANARILLIIVGGLLLGAAGAVKLSSVVLAPLAVGWVMISDWGKWGRFGKLGILGKLGIIGAAAGLAFRFFQPTIFQSASWLDWSLRQDFNQAFNFQRLAIEGKVMFPPQWQWVNTPRWWFPLKNILLWGMGPAAGGLAVAGLIWQIWRIRPIRLKWLIAVWAVVIFLWQGGKFVKTMRYFLPFFPLYALFAAAAVNSLKRTVLARTVLFVGMGVSLLWAIMFTNIYRLPTTRVAASDWIYQNIPAGSKIMLEEWDDPLPLVMSGYEMFDYQTEMVGVYAADDEKKKEQINRWTKDFDWIVLSSPRAKGSIGKLSSHFPLMFQFYRDLDNGSLGFVKAAEFVSYPMLSVNGLRLTINDSSAEESFWVYDHPRVEIYKKS